MKIIATKILPMRSDLPEGRTAASARRTRRRSSARVLTGTGLTVAQAAAALERGERVALTDVQRRIVEAWALER